MATTTRATTTILLPATTTTTTTALKAIRTGHEDKIKIPSTRIIISMHEDIQSAGGNLKRERERDREQAKNKFNVNIKASFGRS